MPGRPDPLGGIAAEAGGGPAPEEGRGSTGSLRLRRLTDAAFASVAAEARAQGGDEALAADLEASYRPRRDEAGWLTKFGFAAYEGGELVGFSLLGVSSWRDLRGYTGADALPGYRGRGVAPRSKPALLHLAFALLGLNRVETGCFASNRSSRRSIEKTPGFVYEGLLREYAVNDAGAFEDEHRYAILARDWRALYADVLVEAGWAPPGGA